MLGFSGV
jgi:hypothetical protein